MLPSAAHSEDQCRETPQESQSENICEGREAVFMSGTSQGSVLVQPVLVHVDDSSLISGVKRPRCRSVSVHVHTWGGTSGYRTHTHTLPQFSQAVL